MKTKHEFMCDFCGSMIGLEACKLAMVNAPNTIGPLPGHQAEDIRFLCSNCKCWNGNEEDEPNED